MSQYMYQFATEVEREDNYWPQFSDGDVLIIISGSRQYQLHSTMLKYASKNNLMKELLSDQNAARLTSKAIKRGAVIRYRLVGVPHNPGADGVNVSIILKAVELNDEGRPVDGQSIGLDLENGLIPSPTHVAYEKVLGSLYGRQTDLGDFDDTNLSDMLVSALNLLGVAEYLGVEHAVTKPIEADLLGKGQTLHRAISSDPAVWLEFACRIKSRTIYKEALIHAAGQLNTQKMQYALNNGILHPVVAEMVNAKGEILRTGVQRATMYMLSYYPAQLQREVTVGYADTDNIGRNSYSNDIFNWMALTAFRHYVGQNETSDSIHNCVDMGYEFMVKIRDGGNAYLARTDLDEFFQRFPMTGKGKTVVEGWLMQIKEYVKRWAVPFFINNSQLDVRRFPSYYFTNTNVGFTDYPFGNDA